MAIPHGFDYVKPRALDEAILALAADRTAQVLAGGTDLVGWLRDELVAPGVVVDIKGVPGLGDITVLGDTFVLGALVTFSDLVDSSAVRERLPLLHETARSMGSVSIRNRATLAGNVCSAVPSCDGGPALLVYEARVRTRGPDGRREIPAAEWFLGPKKTALKGGEIVTGIAVPVPREGHGGCYVKLGRYRGEDLAQASVAVVAVPGREYRVAFGAVAPTPVRARKIESLMKGRALDDGLIEEVVRLIPEETTPITDIRATGEYRAHMLEVMFERGVRAAVARLEGGGPAYGTALF